MQTDHRHRKTALLPSLPLVAIMPGFKIVLIIHSALKSCKKYNFLNFFATLIRGVGTVKFPVKQLKRIPDKFANLLNFLHFQPLISGEAAASPASPVPTPLAIHLELL